jgi:photosystem II stability/assembly factor-like uncharacterized protein
MMMIPLAFLLAAQIAPQSADLPNRQPQLAADGARLLMTYGAGDSVFFTASPDSGKSWSKPVRVASQGKLSLGMRRGPRVVVARQAIVISAVVGEKGRGADGDLIFWRSADGGNTWSSGKPINDVPSAAREGLHTMAANGAGLIFAAWLDLRSKGSRIYGSTSSDGGVTWSPNQLVYESPSGSVCECCHPVAAVDPQGRIYVMFRNSVEGNRDMYLVRSDDGGKTFGPATKAGTGSWKLNACPMDGGGLQVGKDGAAVAVWRRESTVYLSTSSNPEQLIGPGRQPVVAETPAGPVLAWTEGRTLKALRPGQKEAVTLDHDAAFPSIVASPAVGVVLAWERGGTVVVNKID